MFQYTENARRASICCAGEDNVPVPPSRRVQGQLPPAPPHVLPAGQTDEGSLTIAMCGGMEGRGTHTCMYVYMCSTCWQCVGMYTVCMSHTLLFPLPLLLSFPPPFSPLSFLSFAAISATATSSSSSSSPPPPLLLLPHRSTWKGCTLTSGTMVWRHTCTPHSGSSPSTLPSSPCQWCSESWMHTCVRSVHHPLSLYSSNGLHC